MESNLSIEELDWDVSEEFFQEESQILKDKFVGKQICILGVYLEPATWHFPAEYVEYDVDVYIDECYDEDGECISFDMSEAHNHSEYEPDKLFWCKVPYEEFGLSIKQTPEEFLNTLRNVSFDKIVDYIRRNNEGED